MLQDVHLPILTSVRSKKTAVYLGWGGGKHWTTIQFLVIWRSMILHDWVLAPSVAPAGTIFILTSLGIPVESSSTSWLGNSLVFHHF
jgi:hypothetical protein